MSTPVLQESAARATSPPDAEPDARGRPFSTVRPTVFRRVPAGGRWWRSPGRLSGRGAGGAESAKCTTNRHHPRLVAGWRGGRALGLGAPTRAPAPERAVAAGAPGPSPGWRDLLGSARPRPLGSRQTDV